MPEYKSSEESIAYHASQYRSDGDAKFNYDPNGDHWPRTSLIADCVPVGSRVLDVGCNTGGMGRLLMKRRQCLVHGIDVVKSLVDIAVKKGVFAKLGAAENLPYGNEEFDAVVVAELLEHVHDPESVLKEVYRVLKPRGICTGSVPNEDPGVVNDNEASGERYHARIYTMDSLREQVSVLFDIEFIRPVYRPAYFCVVNGTDPNRPSWFAWKGVKK